MPQLEKELLENSLLALYSQTNKSTSFCPKDKKNEIICAFLKRAIKNPKYKHVKSRIRELIQLAKKKDSLEKCIVEKYDYMTKEQHQSETDVEKLYLLLGKLQGCGWLTMMKDLRLEKRIQREKLFVALNEIENSFNDSNAQIDWVSAYINTSRYQEFLDSLALYDIVKVKDFVEVGDNSWEFKLWVWEAA
ncbi:DUF2913 family protein [Vibrio hepatarius]|uniref:DUF2913 family protein n=1 Tax=Vibrio hepatarius TaxID=171383 RepID=UPI001C081F6E|nr:DUF2913 family protein [Vibrio hepatarius]MBU2895706.1 DUF2913 family protein [Vibrio hepatarius]